MNAFSLVLDSLKYVAGQNAFWESMGFTSAMATFVGVLLFNGNVDHAKRGTIAVFAYAIMLLWTTFARILPNAIERNFIYQDGRAFASIVTIFYITVFWLFGILIGVNVFKFRKER